MRVMVVRLVEADHVNDHVHRPVLVEEIELPAVIEVDRDRVGRWRLARRGVEV
jgi:hypothetical protein